MLCLRRNLLALVVALALLLLGSPSIAQDNGTLLAPKGVTGEIYYAPFPVTITLDGDLSDWAGVPRASMAMQSKNAGVSFAAAADSEFLYLSGDVLDDNIISGAHGTDFWNEDSLEFYLNGTGDLKLTKYTDGVAQLTIPPLNIGRTGDDLVLGGVQGTTVDARFIVVSTETGYIVEIAVPLHNDVWNIVPTHAREMGFQVHLNGASQSNRDTKLIWSVYDLGDQSYQNPSVFGKLVFFEIGQEMEGLPSDSVDGSDAVEIDTSITWDSRQWKLLWSDEFEGTAGTPLNAEFWTYDVGGDGWGNNELEFYTDRIENSSLDGSGNLAIVARQENPENYICHFGKCMYTSARVVTRGKVEFTYGRVEARIRIPRGQGIWPAFWLLGADIGEVGWPASGEIDIMENVGFEPKTVHGTIHGPGYSGAAGIGGSYSIDQDFADDYHVFAIDWDPEVIRWYVDGELMNIVSVNDLNGRKWVHDHDFYILLNVAVGGTWPRNPDDTTVFPQTMLVDYVRVYQLAQ